jgi:hypothetical protein
MSDLIWLSEAQMRRIEPYFPLSLTFRALPVRYVLLRSCRTFTRLYRRTLRKELEE